MKTLWKKLKPHQHKIFIGFTTFGFLAVFLIYKRFFPDFDLQKLLNDFAGFLGDWTYLIAAGLSFLETGAFIGMLVPGETILIISGAVAGQGVINLYLLLGLAWLCAFLGDSFSFLLGYKLGNDFLRKHGSKVGMTPERLDTVEEYFAKHGGKTILIGRFVGLVRAFAPFVAGSSKMSYKAFAPYSILGSGLQVSAAIILGYIFSKNIDKAIDYIGQGTFWLGTTIAVVLSIVFSIRFLCKKENRVRLRDFLLSKSYLAWICKIYYFIKPGIIFISDRFQPGEKFGLEVTSLLAAIAVSSFVVIAYLNNIASDPELITWGDKVAQDISASLDAHIFTIFAELFTAFGSRTAVSLVLCLAALFFVLKRNWILLLVMVLSVITIESWNDIITYLVSRPETDSFPNRSAAFSILYTWLAIVFLNRISQKIIHKGLVLLGAIIFTALIGLSNVYLGENFLSDSNAGWAFGVLIFAIYSTVFLVFSQLHRLPSFIEPEELEEVLPPQGEGLDSTEVKESGSEQQASSPQKKQAGE